MSWYFKFALKVHLILAKGKTWSNFNFRHVSQYSATPKSPNIFMTEGKVDEVLLGRKFQAFLFNVPTWSALGIFQARPKKTMLMALVFFLLVESLGIFHFW